MEKRGSANGAGDGSDKRRRTEDERGSASTPLSAPRRGASNKPHHGRADPIDDAAGRQTPTPTKRPRDAAAVAMDDEVDGARGAAREDAAGSMAAADVKAQLLLAIHRFREAEARYWLRWRKAEQAAREMGQMCVELELFATRLEGKPVVPPEYGLSSPRPSHPQHRDRTDGSAAAAAASSTALQERTERHWTSGPYSVPEVAEWRGSAPPSHGRGGGGGSDDDDDDTAGPRAGPGVPPPLTSRATVGRASVTVVRPAPKPTLTATPAAAAAAARSSAISSAAGSSGAAASASTADVKPPLALSANVAPPPPAVAAVWPQYLLRPRISSKPGETILLNTLREREVLLRLRTDVSSTKAFPRKPRSLLIHPGPDVPFNDVIATRWAGGPVDGLHSALNGNIQCWSYKDRALIAEFRREQLHYKWPEAMCWVGGGVGLGVCYPELAESSRQVSLVYFNANYQDHFEFKFHHMRTAPHTIGLASICALNRADDTLEFVTGGRDKQVALWRVDPGRTRDVDYGERVTILPTRHTSEVRAVAASSNGSSIYSGGSDRKLFIWSVSNLIPVMSLQMTGRVNFIEENPVDPNILLVALSDKANQLALVDARSGHNVSQFGWDEKEALSGYIHPTWHPRGHLIACGSSKPLVNVWDIRCVRPYVPQTISLHENRVLRCAFHPVDDCLVAISSDNNISFSTYTRDVVQHV